MDVRLRKWRWPGAIGIALAAALLIFTPALAQDTTAGNITLDQDVTGNQYLFGNTVTVNGNVDGDLTVFGRSLTLNGEVTGDLLFGGSWLLIHGKVDGDVRTAGAVIVLDEGNQIGGDLMGAGYSVEMRPGSSVGGQVLAAGAQIVLEDVKGNVQTGSGSLRVNGEIGGNVTSSVGTAKDASSGDPFVGMRGQDPNMPTASTVPGGLTFGPDGKIKGKLTYDSTQESQFPAGSVAGKTSFTQNRTTQQRQQDQSFFATTAGRTAGYFVASLIALIILGVILQRTRPSFLGGSADVLRRRIAASLGVGILGYVVFFGLIVVLTIFAVLAIPLLFVAMGQRFYGAITLTGLGAMTIFIVLTNWLAPLVVAALVGEWAYGQIDRERKSPFWSLVIGLVIVLLAISIPVIGRPLIGGLVATVGLGAVILYLWPKKPTPALEAPPAPSANPG